MSKDYRDYSDVSKPGWAIIRRHGKFQVVMVRYRVGSQGQYVSLVDDRMHSGEADTLVGAREHLATAPNEAVHPKQLDGRHFQRWW